MYHSPVSSISFYSNNIQQAGSSFKNCDSVTRLMSCGNFEKVSDMSHLTFFSFLPSDTVEFLQQRQRCRACSKLCVIIHSHHLLSGALWLKVSLNFSYVQTSWEAPLRRHPASRSSAAEPLMSSSPTAHACCSAWLPSFFPPRQSKQCR